MFTILSKEQLADSVYRITVRAPLIAREHSAGQFVIVQPDTEYGERIPLTIADKNADLGTINLIFQAVGKSTLQMSEMKNGESLVNILGPLGKPTHIENFGRTICVCGGIGAAPMYPILQALKAAGNFVTVILGARNKDLLILENEMRELADEMIVCTDDGSYGRKALVTVPLAELCEAADRPDMVFAIGPPIMMKFAAEVTRPFAIPTTVSLNTIMIDGTGMCGGCRVSVKGETKFTCVDGPEFDGHQVDFTNLIARLSSYSAQEKESLQQHSCKAEAFAQKIEKTRQGAES